MHSSVSCMEWEFIFTSSMFACHSLIMEKWNYWIKKKRQGLDLLSADLKEILLNYLITDQLHVSLFAVNSQRQISWCHCETIKTAPWITDLYSISVTPTSGLMLRQREDKITDLIMLWRRVWAGLSQTRLSRSLPVWILRKLDPQRKWAPVVGKEREMIFGSKAQAQDSNAETGLRFRD